MLFTFVGGAGHYEPLRPIATCARDAGHQIVVACRPSMVAPDIVVADEVDYGAILAAEVLGIPHVTVLVLITGTFARADVVGDQLNELHAELGLDADPSLEMLRRHLVVAPFPSCLRDPGFPLPPTARSLRPGSLDTDAPPIARRCAELGVALTLDPVDATADAVRDAVGALLADGVHRRRAQQIKAEIDALPAARTIIPVLEQLAG